MLFAVTTHQTQCYHGICCPSTGFGQTHRLIEFWLNYRFTYHCFVYLLHSFHWKYLQHVVLATFAMISVPLMLRDVVDIYFVCFHHRCHHRHHHCCQNHNTAALGWQYWICHKTPTITELKISLSHSMNWLGNLFKLFTFFTRWHFITYCSFHHKWTFYFTK